MRLTHFHPPSRLQTLDIFGLRTCCQRLVSAPSPLPAVQIRIRELRRIALLTLIHPNGSVLNERILSRKPCKWMDGSLLPSTTSLARIQRKTTFRQPNWQLLLTMKFLMSIGEMRKYSLSTPVNKRTGSSTGTTDERQPCRNRSCRSDLKLGHPRHFHRVAEGHARTVRFPLRWHCESRSLP